MTENKIISLFHHIVKTIDKEAADISKDDLISFYTNSKYSAKTIGWSNSILRGYFGMDVPTAEEIGVPIVTATQSTISSSRLVEILQRMHEVIERGGGHAASFAAVLIMLLSCQKYSNTMQLSGRHVATLLEDDAVDVGGAAFVILPHLRDLVILNGKTVRDILRDIAPSLDASSKLECAQSFLALCSGTDTLVYGEFYKFSRDALRLYMRNVPADKEYFASELLDIERAGFRGRGAASSDYTKWLLGQIES